MPTDQDFLSKAPTTIEQAKVAQHLPNGLASDTGKHLGARFRQHVRRHLIRDDP
jgi:hypothetical protein